MMRLEQLGAQQKRSVPDLIRASVDAFLLQEKRRAESDLRHLRVTEYLQIAVDWIIQQDHPEMRDQMIAQCNQRMQQYHGVR